MTDIAPELLEKIQSSFTSRFNRDKIIADVYWKVSEGTATYKEAEEFAARAGELLANALKMHISADNLPDGRLYYNIAERVLGPLLANNYELASDVAVRVQGSLNRAAGISLKAVRPRLNEDRVTGIIEKVSGAERFEDVAWVLDEPIVNFTQSVVDDAIRENVEFQAKAGLSPKITRTVTGNCCEWCAGLAGKYDYPAPRDVYRRHERCRCMVLYDPGDGRKQNAHSKRWLDPEQAEKIELRKRIGTESFARAFVDNPKLLGQYTPESLKKALEKEGYKVSTLSSGSFQGIPFERGGGFKINFSDGGILMYHPAERSHHGGAYYKISTGKGGRHRYDINGAEKPD